MRSSVERCDTITKRESLKRWVLLNCTIVFPFIESYRRNVFKTSWFAHLTADGDDNANGKTRVVVHV